ncbi:MAG: NAD-dependent epimerase/dehydratase family protein [Dehalococcoidia bacterium]
MDLLILGGTVFVGRHLVDAALEHEHQVTLFNRGQHNPDLYPEVEKLRGDRDGDLDALRGRRWDAVIDTSGYVPRIVRASAELLANAVEQYSFISTISVFNNFSRPNADESTPVGKIEDETIEDRTKYYGPLKALCEQAAEAAMPGRVLTIRPGLIVGPHDPTDRFTYWPRRVAQGDEVLAPGRPGRPVQIIDGRDLAEWNIRMIEAGGRGIYNATGPDYQLTMGQMLEECRTVTGTATRFIWVDEQFLLDQGVTPWREIPVWLPESGDTDGFSTVNCAKAIAAGLTFRPLADTIRATLEWDAIRLPATGDDTAAPLAGLKPEREQALLRAWSTRA